QAWLFLIGGIALFGFYFWLIKEYGDDLLPPSASLHGEDVDSLMNFNLWVINIAWVIVQILLFYFAWKYYYRPGAKAVFFPHSNKLEMIWTIVPASFLAIIIIYGLKTWNEIVAEPEEEPIVIELYAKQFDWTARYAGKDNILGEASVRRINGANFLGIDSADVHAKDDKIVKGEFHLPVGRPVKFIIRSQDVIHSAYMPHFRAQMNAVPGMKTSINFIPTVTTEEMRKMTKNPDFDYILLCNKICGASHYNMQMDIIVESEDKFNDWLNQQKEFISTSTVELENKSSKIKNL
ncbi:MAG: cytochrome c oxidase subunit II, partial [Bacteroidetes bacterium]